MLLGPRLARLAADRSAVQPLDHVEFMTASNDGHWDLGKSILSTWPAGPQPPC